MEKLGSDVLYNHADYRLMSRRALCALSEFDEVNLFLRGLVRLVGYPSSVVYYKRAERYAGESKYPLGKMLSFAFEGISSFSTKPLKFVTIAGGGVSAIVCKRVNISVQIIDRAAENGETTSIHRYRMDKEGAENLWALSTTSLLAPDASMFLN